jgi:hypothetical protein
MMAAPSRTAPTTPPPCPADVADFAAAHQVDASLQPLLEGVRRIFPTAQHIRVWLELDPELRDERHIIYDVTVTGLTPAESVEAHNEWSRELRRHCPGTLTHLFRLLVDLH